MAMEQRESKPANITPLKESTPSQPISKPCWCGGTGALPRGRQYEARYTPERKRVGNWCPCPIGEAVADEYFRKLELHKREKEEERAFDVWMEEIPCRFYDWSLATHPNKDLAQRLLAILENEDEEKPQSLFLYGGYGIGKTGLAIGYLRERVFKEHETSIKFVRTPDLLTELRSTYNKNAEDITEAAVLGKYINARVLLLDDLGAEQVTGSGWVEDRLYQIIGARHDNLSCTIFTSNLSLDVLAQKLGERLVWRILEMCEPDGVIEVKGPNLRDKKRQTTR